VNDFYKNYLLGVHNMKITYIKGIDADGPYGYCKGVNIHWISQEGRLDFYLEEDDAYQGILPDECELESAIRDWIEVEQQAPNSHWIRMLRAGCIIPAPQLKISYICGNDRRGPYGMCHGRFITWRMSKAGKLGFDLYEAIASTEPEPDEHDLRCQVNAWMREQEQLSDRGLLPAIESMILCSSNN
jgi:hypothetical protein